MTSPIACTCPNWCPRHATTEVTDTREAALLDSLDHALDACRATKAPPAVYASLFAGTSLAIELGRAG